MCSNHLNYFFVSSHCLLEVGLFDSSKSKVYVGKNNKIHIFAIFYSSSSRYLMIGQMHFFQANVIFAIKDVPGMIYKKMLSYKFNEVNIPLK